MTRKYANSLIQLTKWTKDAAPRTKDLPRLSHPQSKKSKADCWLLMADGKNPIVDLRNSRHMQSRPEELKRKQKWNYVAPGAGQGHGLGGWGVAGCTFRVKMDGMENGHNERDREGREYGQPEEVKWMNGWMDKGHRMLHKSLPLCRPCVCGNTPAVSAVGS